MATVAFVGAAVELELVVGIGADGDDGDHSLDVEGHVVEALESENLALGAGWVKCCGHHYKGSLGNRDSLQQGCKVSDLADSSH